MLKLTPRTITALILTIFVSAVLFQQYVWFLESDKVTDAAEARVHRRSTDIARSFGLQWLDRLDYDLHLRSHNRGLPHPDVAVIEINERSLARYQYFPFRRSVYIDLIRRLEKAGAKVVAFDITFSGKERNAFEELNRLREELIQAQGFDSAAAQMVETRMLEVDSDERFSNALNETNIPVILGYSFADEDASRKANDLKDEEAERILAEGETLLHEYGIRPLRNNTRLDKDGNELPLVSTLSKLDNQRPVLNLPQIVRSLNKSSGIGQFMPSIDDDSVIRRVPMIFEYKRAVLGSLALHATAAYLGEEPVYHFEDGELSLRSVARGADGKRSEGRLYAPLTPWGDMLVRFYGGEREFPYYEFSDVVDPAKSEAELRKQFGGKMVFVGVTAIGLKDIRATPFTKDYPGVEVHATVASNLLQMKYMVRDTRFFLWGYALVILFGALSAVAVYRFHPIMSFAVSVLLIAILQVGANSFFFNNGVVVPTILPSLCAFTVFFAGVLYRYFTEEREKKVVRAAFSRYVSGAVVEEILKDQTKLRLGGQKKELTVMFVDLVGFTKIAEHLDAGVVTQLLNEYFTRMTSILLANQGTLDKYMGDGIMCFWGAPLDIADHARLACKTALEMRAELARINTEWKSRHNIVIENRIGIHTGDMAVGNMGSDQVFSYTVMGDNVNLASRLEGVNTVYGTHIVVSTHTAEQSGKEFLFRPLDKVRVKGRDESVEIMELVSAGEEKEPEWVHAFRVGLKHYRAGEWDDAESAFGACLSLKPGDGPSQVFVERIRDFRIVEPEEWSGVWKLSQK